MESGTSTITITIVATAFAGIVLILRCISRTVILPNSGADDLFAVLSYLSSLVCTCLIYAQYKHGLGRNSETVSEAERSQMLKYLWASVLVFGLGMTFLCISTAAQYLRFLFSRGYRVLCWTLIILNTMLGFATLIIGIWTCRPLAFFWNKSIVGGTCIDQFTWWYFSAAWIVCISFVTSITPIMAVKDINLPPASKGALVGVFALAGFECVAAILRVYFIWVISVSTNVTNDISRAHAWASLELNIGVICVSLPPLRALYHAVITRRKTEQRSNSVDQENPTTPGSIQSQPSCSDSSNSIKPKFERDPYAIP